MNVDLNQLFNSESGANGPLGPLAQIMVPSGSLSPSFSKTVSPHVIMLGKSFKKFLGSDWRMNASKSPPHNEFWTISGELEISAEISVPYWPTNNFGVTFVLIFAEGFNIDNVSVKSLHESTPQA